MRHRSAFVSVRSAFAFASGSTVVAAMTIAACSSDPRPTPAGSSSGGTTIEGGVMTPSEAGTDAGAVDAAVLGDACPAEDGAHEGSCVCASGDCAPSCNKGGCAFDCLAGSTCAPTCSGGGCTITCAANATCSGKCPAGGCTFHCAVGATCSNSCNGGNCTFDCPDGSACSSSCPPGNCH